VNGTGDKLRLDDLLVRRGMVRSRNEAQIRIRQGEVRVAGVAARKPSQRVLSDIDLSLTPQGPDYVSRGALKLARALDVFKLDVTGKAALDVGASTGGFTEILLSRGVRHVTALDVGHAQLAAKLRNDPRVRVMEGVNARHLKAGDLSFIPEIITCDVSFISLALVLPPVLALAGSDAWLIALIKPQFELAPEDIGKGGIVRDEGARQRACDKIRNVVNAQKNWRVKDVIASPITGGDGNREFLLAARSSQRF
jgi:23S rRNA (cytidine1920-2'-O)/16S rRNA (cytidine1409-2'-O)-methyltransferase